MKGSKYLLVAMLLLMICCSKSQDEPKQTELAMLAEKVGSEFNSMVSHSLLKLSYSTITETDVAEQISIIEEGVVDWLKVNNYYDAAKPYYDASIAETWSKEIKLEDLSGVFKKSFNPRQIEIIQGILVAAGRSSFEDFHKNVKTIEESIGTLPKEDQLYLLTMVELIKGACNAAKTVSITDPLLSTDSGIDSKKDGKFWCNLTSGGLGSIYGAWAGGIAAAVFGASAIATGGITVAVTLVVGAAISTIAC